MINGQSEEGIHARIQQIRQKLPESVRLIAITKKCPSEAIRIAYTAGLRDFGESQVQEASSKQEMLQDLPDIRWHLIGHLQTNKARKALERFDWIQSLDSLKLAKRLDDLAAQLSKTPKICLQVKLRSDPTKYGFTVPELMESLPYLNGYTHLKIVGLMMIPPNNLPESETQAIFSETQVLADQINQQNWTRIHIQHLSMGMSGDYSLAIAAGSTMIRLGQILFGERLA